METHQQYLRLQRAENGPGTPSSAKKAGYAADTHWYSNVGGTVVKVCAPGADEAIRVEDRQDIEAVPGQAVAAARKKLRMNEPVIGLNAELYCRKVLASTWIGVEGPFVKKFERALARICGCVQACAVSSGTAALYGALKALGVKSRDQHVIVPTYTCSACADAVVHCGAVPVCVDCEPETYGLSYEAVLACLEEDKSVCGVVYAPCYGAPSRDFHRILALCAERGIWLAEDACESYGAWIREAPGSYRLIPLGSSATISVVSVRSEKMIGVGEGGAILSKDADLVQQARWWCARAPTRGAGLWRVYEHDAVGQNYRMPELLAAVGLAAAETLPVTIQAKTRIHQRYAEAFSGSVLKLQYADPLERPVWWLNSVLLPKGTPFSAEKLGLSIMEANPEVEVRPAFYPLHWMAPFKESARPCPVAEDIYGRLFCLPSSAHLGDGDVAHVANAVLDALRRM